MATRPQQPPQEPPDEVIQAGPGRPRRNGGGGRPRQSIGETAIKSFIRSIAGSLGRAIMRAIVGGRR